MHKHKAVKHAIILAGGFGTRLKHIVSDVPKPMAPIQNKPFLDIQIRFLRSQGIRKIILATGHLHEVIAAYFSSHPIDDVEIHFSREEEALGTGGAIFKAINSFKERDLIGLSESILVINGDTYFDFDLSTFVPFHQKKRADISLLLKEMIDFDRYGSVSLEEASGKILRFNEKRKIEKGLINAGGYLIKTNLIEQLSSKITAIPFSFEQQILEQSESLKLSLYGQIQSGYFIDIGIPEDYFEAQKTLKDL